MNHNIAILDLPAPSLSPEAAARSFRAERIPLAPPLPDRDLKWRWAVAIIAALLLHIGVVGTIDDGFLRKKSPAPAPVPVEIVTELPKPPPPEEKPVQKPQPQSNPPEAQQLQPDLHSGGTLKDRTAGTPSPTESPQDRPRPAPAQTPPPVASAPATASPAPPLPTEPAPDAISMPATSAARDTKAAVPLPVPPKKPPLPVAQQAAIPQPEQQAAIPQPLQPDPPAGPYDQLNPLGEGGGDKYLNAMRDSIINHRFYPPTAEMFGWVGVAIYKIQIDRKGQLMGVRLVKSSGYDLLDKAGLTTIKNAAPFGPVPPGFARGLETIVVDLTLPIP
jgi:protein TonB